MGEVRAAAQNELTRTIAERLRGVWDAYVRVDAQAHSALLPGARGGRVGPRTCQRIEFLAGCERQGYTGFREMETETETRKRFLWVS
jgi:hypothetical protein